VGLSPEASVFSLGPGGRRPLHPRVLTRRFLRLCDRLRLRAVRLHGLRYSETTRLLAAGFWGATVPGRLANRSAVLLGR